MENLRSHRFGGLPIHPWKAKHPRRRQVRPPFHRKAWPFRDRSQPYPVTTRTTRPCCLYTHTQACQHYKQYSQLPIYSSSSIPFLHQLFAVARGRGEQTLLEKQGTCSVDRPAGRQPAACMQGRSQHVRSFSIMDSRPIDPSARTPLKLMGGRANKLSSASGGSTADALVRKHSTRAAPPFLGQAGIRVAGN